MADMEAISSDGNVSDEESLSAVARRLRPLSFESRYELLKRLDPHFAELWIRYKASIFRRPKLDMETRLLILVGQYTMQQDSVGVADAVHAALDLGTDPRKVLEVILQCYTYGGERTVDIGVDAYAEVVEARGLLDEIEHGGLSADALDVDMSDIWLEQEKRDWAEADLQDPRVEHLLSKYDARGLSTGFRLRPGMQINMMTVLDLLDQELAALWSDTIYGGMYRRGILDDRTRLLCMVGDCLAAGEMYQAPRHMRGALRQGATPAEVFEVIIQSFPVVGHPALATLAVDDLLAVLSEERRLDELVDEAAVQPLMTIVDKRIRDREGVREMSAADGRAD